MLLDLKNLLSAGLCHRFLLKSPVELGLAGLRKVGCPTMETYQYPRSQIICLGRCWKCSWAQGNEMKVNAMKVINVWFHAKTYELSWSGRNTFQSRHGCNAWPCMTSGSCLVVFQNVLGRVSTTQWFGPCLLTPPGFTRGLRRRDELTSWPRMSLAVLLVGCRDC